MKFLAFVGEPWGHDAIRRADLGDRLAGVFDGSDASWVDVVMWRYVFCLNWHHRLEPHWTERYECVNFHCTPLPCGRGGHPIENMILAGHTETVITAHRMTEELDAGPIYGTRGPISLAGTKDEILARFVEPCADLIRWIVETEPTPTPQQGTPTYFKRLTPEAYTQFWAQRTHG